MNLAEKIMTLRKQKGWSQEELADRLDISRQSVSKWEGGMSVPEIDKIVAMSSLFGVSTDYLLKDEAEKEILSRPEEEEEKKSARVVSQEEAENFMELTRKLAARMAFAVFLLILSPTPLILLSGAAEYKGQYDTWYDSWALMLQRQEEKAAGIGIVFLLILAAVGVAILILCSLKLEKYEYMERENLNLQYGAQGIARKKKEAFAGRYSTCITTGVVLCIVGAIPLLLSGIFSESELLWVFCTDILLVIVAAAVYLFVWAGTIQGSFDKLLQEGDYTAEKKEVMKKTSYFAGAYWCVVTALFVGISMFTDNWRQTTVIWPVAALLFVAIQYIVKEVVRARMDKKK